MEKKNLVKIQNHAVLRKNIENKEFKPIYEPKVDGYDNTSTFSHSDWVVSSHSEVLRYSMDLRLWRIFSRMNKFGRYAW